VYSIDSFLRPLEKAAEHLRQNRKVDVQGLLATSLFARFWFGVISGESFSRERVVVVVVEMVASDDQYY